MTGALRLIVGLLLLFPPSTAVRAQALPAAAEVRSVEVLYSIALTPRDLGEGWADAGSPTHWKGSHAGMAGPPAWYRVRFALPEPRDESIPYSLYLPYLYDGGRIWLNGQPVASIAQSDFRTHVRWERPHLVALPESLLRRGENELLVRAVASDPGAGQRLSRLSIAPSAELLPVHERRLFWVRTMPQVAAITCLVTGCFVLSIWWRRRSEVLYGLFGLACLLWSLRTLIFVVEALPQELWPWWRGLYHAATGGFIVALTLFALRFAGLHRPRLAWGLVAYGLLGPLALLLSGGRLDSWVGFWWTAGLIPVGLALIALAWLAAWRQRSAESLALAIAVSLGTLAGIHDFVVAWEGAFALLARLEGARQWMETRVFLLHHGANLMLLVMVGILTLRFVRSLDAAEEMNQRLEQRVAEREAAWRQEQAQVLRLQAQQAAREERELLLQDLHDGLGSRLFTTLSRVERGSLAGPELAHALRECIADMRLLLDVGREQQLRGEGADAEMDSGLAALLADLRFRWEPVLHEAGVTATWDLELEPAAQLPATVTVQLLHILQEALTNVVKHAQARTARVRLLATASRAELTVEDDGRGWSPANVEPDAAGVTATAATPVGLPSTAPGASGGQGLRGMQLRARRIGARLRLSTAPAGSRVQLQWAAAGEAALPEAASS